MLISHALMRTNHEKLVIMNSFLPFSARFRFHAQANHRERVFPGYLGPVRLESNLRAPFSPAPPRSDSGMLLTSTLKYPPKCAGMQIQTLLAPRTPDICVPDKPASLGFAGGSNMGTLLVSACGIQDHLQRASGRCSPSEMLHSFQAFFDIVSAQSRVQ